MENGVMSFNAEEGVKVTADNFDSLITQAEHSDDFIVIKDNKYRFCYMNKVCRYYRDIPDNFDYEGRIISELPTYLADYQDVVHGADDKILSSKKSVNFTTLHKYGPKRNYTQLIMSNASPIVRDDETIGMIIRGRKLDFFTSDDFMCGRPPDVIRFGNPSELFNDREFEIIFYHLQRFSEKEIAEKLFKSYRTIQNDIQNIYEKAGISGTNARKQFIDWCQVRGYDRYVPVRFLGHSPIKFFD